MSEFSSELLEDFRGFSTATITTVLLKHGLRNVWFRGAFPLFGTSTVRVAGPAFTMRFIPAREDLATPASWASPTSSRAAIEAMPDGAIVVVDAGGCREAGIFGDILVARMQGKGGTALVTDGVIRDLDGVVATGFPVWAAGRAAPPSVAGLTFVGWQEPVGCGGVAVFPGDLIVADNDGAVVVPAALAEPIRAQCAAQERLETWIMQKVESGAKLPGLYPPSEEMRALYREETGEDI